MKQAQAAVTFRCLRYEPLKLNGRQWPALEVALIFIASKRPQKLELVFGLHALLNDLELQVMGQADDGASNRRILAISGDVAYERSIYFQLVQREPLEVAETRIPGTEIVDGNMYSDLAQLFQEDDGFRRVCMMTLSVISISRHSG